VREKVTFLAEAPPATAAPANASPAEPPAPSPDAEQSAEEHGADGQPRRAGWWTRRFGGGE